MASEHQVDRCATCGARIRWTTTARGAALAVDADPDPTGNQACYTDAAGTLRSRGISTERPVVEHAEVLYRPHVASGHTPRGTTGAPQHRRTGVRPPPWRRP
ncbi:hypothetical protein [Streptomyces sp. NPDC058665]|uniref:hypothetical protein n=1 Tax=Streptomyces sp. NPDC058665 TaxID=3346586 RepID=UPI0036464A1A